MAGVPRPDTILHAFKFHNRLITRCPRLRFRRMTPSDDDRWPRPEIYRSLRRRAGERRARPQALPGAAALAAPGFQGAAGFSHRHRCRGGGVDSTRRAGCSRRIPSSARKAADPSSATSGSSTPSTARRISPAASRTSPSPSLSCATAREIGVVYDVMHSELYTAQRGRGATLNGEPIRVSGLPI